MGIFSWLLGGRRRAGPAPAPWHCVTAGAPPADWVGPPVVISSAAGPVFSADTASVPHTSALPVVGALVPAGAGAAGGPPAGGGREEPKTEAEWLACEDPEAMLAHLTQLDAGPSRHAGQPPQRLTVRKVRLLACAFCRQVWHLLADERARRAVEVAERFADGEATEAERAQAEFVREELGRTVPADSPALASLRAAIACSCAVEAAGAGVPAPWLAFALAAGPLRRTSFYAAGACARGAHPSVGYRVQAAAVRELFNPFRPALLEPMWAAWDGGAVRRLAEAIYRGRCFEDLPILADALEDAGCADSDLLGHLRSAGPHVRGCWALDLILGKD